MKPFPLKPDLFWVGILDKDLRVFDIIMRTEFGTTYNSYILKCGGETVLFETVKERFFAEYEKTLSETMEIGAIDYIVVDHTEPDHAGSIAKLLEKNPRAKIIATPVAIRFLKNIVNGDFYSIPVKNGDTLKIGRKTLRFFVLPNLHWPDTMYTYIVEDKALVTCDSFGSHYAHEGILRSAVTDEEGYLRATKYYFDNILGPFRQPYLARALEVVRALEIDMICPGHGPVLDSHIGELLALYDEWCKIPQNGKPTVVIPYVSAYGYTAQLAEHIGKGIRQAGDIAVKAYDMVTADAAEVSAEIAAADGLLFGTPTILGEALKPIWDLATSLFPPVHGGKPAGAFGSYGWSGEGVLHITERLKQLHMDVVEGYRVRLKPSETELAEAVEFGYRFGLKLLRKAEPEKPGARSGLVKCLVCGEIFDSSHKTCPVCGVGSENFVPVASQDTGFRRDTPEKFLILGGGTAALNAAKAIRLRNRTASVTILSEESEAPYDRPMLTKNMFGQTGGGAIASVEPAWYTEHNVTLLRNSRVARLDTGRKEAVLEDGTAYPYDICIYALGAYSFIPPIKGKELPEVTPVRTIADVEKVNRIAEGAKRAVVIGGGVLGLEAAWELRKEKLEVTVLETASLPLAGRIDADTAGLLLRIAGQNGIAVKTGARVAEISGNGHVDGVLLEGGEKIPADLVILSTGVRPNTAIAKEAGLPVEYAVVVNEKMETGVEGVYACGDCAQFQGAYIASWPVASEMGRIAGANAAGEAIPYRPETQGMAFFGMNTALYAIGDIGTKADAPYKTLEIRDDKKHRLEKYYFLNDAICGVTLLGDTSKMAAVTDAVRTRKAFREIF